MVREKLPKLGFALIILIVAVSAWSGIKKMENKSRQKLANHSDNLNPVFVDFTETGWEKRLYLADYSVDDTHFYRVNFSPDTLSQNGDGLKLVMKSATETGNWPWDSGEIHVPRKTGYGRYEVFMKPAKADGVISSFFTYTGPFYGDPHDEIDIEFLGKTQDEVEFNTYINGRATGGVQYKLGYTASEEFHLYAFVWEPDSISFFIDNTLVHKISGENVEIPRFAGKMMINLWTGTLTDWHGEAGLLDGVTAHYKCMAYRPSGNSTSPLCSNQFGL